MAASGDATGVLAGVPVFMYTPSDDELAKIKDSEESSTPENETGDVNATARESGPEKVNYNGESTSVYRGGNDFTIKSDEVKIIQQKCFRKGTSLRWSSFLLAL